MEFLNVRIFVDYTMKSPTNQIVENSVKKSSSGNKVSTRGVCSMSRFCDSGNQEAYFQKR